MKNLPIGSFREFQVGEIASTSQFRNTYILVEKHQSGDDRSRRREVEWRQIGEIELNPQLSSRCQSHSSPEIYGLECIKVRLQSDSLRAFSQYCSHDKSGGRERIFIGERIVHE